MLSLIGAPFVAGRMMGKGAMMRDGGLWGNAFLFFHTVVGILFVTLLFLGVVYLWKKIEMLDHEKDHHHDHSKKG